MDYFILKRHNSFLNLNNKKHTYLLRDLIDHICIESSSPKTDQETNYSYLENRSFEDVSFPQ